MRNAVSNNGPSDLTTIRRAFESVLRDAAFTFSPAPPDRLVSFREGCERMDWSRSGYYAILKAQAEATKRGIPILGVPVPVPHKRGKRNVFHERQITEYINAVTARKNHAIDASMMVTSQSNGQSAENGHE